ncbi:class I SAM-dependent methyltransferase [Vibrio cholerae]|uniref:methyltransferase domain-containing protein n=1 Tax=Vibrio cholerae TaxID=666 RepID=UPI003966E6DB|nr:class I SAM-dependent methyltransferase [Vibrio cholerae]
MSVTSQLNTSFNGFITSQALLLADHLDFFSHFNNTEICEEKDIRIHYSDYPAAIDAVLNALHIGGVISRDNKKCQLLVKLDEIKNKLPFFRLWFFAYRELLSQQIEVVDSRKKEIPYDGASVAKYSAQIGSIYVDPYLDSILEELSLTGKICDMGCGAGVRLLRICKKNRLQGLGMDIDFDAIEVALKNKKLTNNNDVDFICQDITKIKTGSPDIEAMLFTFFTHHIQCDDILASMLQEYKDYFINLKYIIIFDTVSDSNNLSEDKIFSSGFDYIHRIQGLIPRTREDYYNVFDKAELAVEKEISLPVDNSFIWVCKLRDV